MIRAALALAAEGFKVFPIAAGRKAPPLLNDWPRKATSDPKEVEMYWLAVPDANVGIHCVGMIVLDIDIAKGGADSYAKLDMLFGFPSTRTARTPSGGEHRYFRGPVVGNSVGVLGAGLDIRSSNGYVVAPGSSTPAGAYEWVDPAVEIADAPDWLVAKLGTIVPKTGTTAPERVADAPAEVVERAAGWLKFQDPAIEGQGGDARTFAVACGLRDHGVSAAQARVLLEEWNDRCAPPWAPEDLDAKVANAYRYAENAPGVKAALPSDFPEITPAVNSVSRPKVKQLQTLTELAADETAGPGHVVKGLLQRASYAAIYGAPGEGKTFVALDLAYHVAAGLEWQGHGVHGGTVLYLAYEGQGGLRKRAKALRQRYGQGEVPLFVAGASYNLREVTGRRELADTLALLPTKPVLIVVDTFARALMGGDENSAQDVGAFNAAVAALIENTGACVAIIHHSGKDKSKGARGSSALLGALDTEIEIDEGKITATKQRDVDLGAPIGFKLVPIMVGIDADGDEVTSCVVEPAATSGARIERVSGNVKRGFDVLCAMSPDNREVDPRDWRDKCVEFLGKTAVSQRFYDIKKALLAKGYIEVTEQDMVKRRMT